MTFASFLMMALHAHTWQFRITSEGIPSLDLPVDDIALGQIARPHHGAVLEVLAPVGFDQLFPGLVLEVSTKRRLDPVARIKVIYFTSCSPALRAGGS